MSFRLPHGFSFFGRSDVVDEKKAEQPKAHGNTPNLKLQTDKEVYRPGDLLTVTIEISVPAPDKLPPEDAMASFLIDNLAAEIKGIEKVDTQWFVVEKTSSSTKLKRGEHLLLDCATPSLVSKVLISPGLSKSYLLRAELPKILPPSYRGTTIRYIYYIKSTLCGRWMALDNGHWNKGLMSPPVQVEARIPLQIWILQKGNIFLGENGQIDECFPAATVQMDAYWKEKDADSEWIRANELPDGVEEGYDSSRDDISSLSSYNPMKGVDTGIRNSFSLQSLASRYSINESRYSQGEPSNLPSYPLLSQLSISEVADDSSVGFSPPGKEPPYSLDGNSSFHRKTFSNSLSTNDHVGGLAASRSVETGTSEGFVRGRSYNIRIDDQILLRFSPRNSDSSHYFGDLIGGTLTFFHGEGSRRCLEVAVSLEISETITQRYVHPSRRSSPKITKIHCDHHEVVADLLQTSFLFSIPMDGPMSFSTPHISVDWTLHFEFFTTPKNVDWSRYGHPLLVEGREKGDWFLPISVNAPPQRTRAVDVKNGRVFTLGNSGVQS